MKKKFRLYNKHVSGPVIPRFGLDTSFRALRLGTRLAETVVHNEESAGQVFALRMARREYGKRASVRAFKEDGVAGENGKIFVVWLQDASGRLGKEERFAVMAS